MLKPKVLLIDLDGTLVRGDGLRFRIQFFASLFCEWQASLGFQSFFKSLSSLKSALYVPNSHDSNETRLVRAFARLHQMPEEEARSLLRELTSRAFRSVDDLFSPVEGAKEFLTWGRTRFPLVLATNPIWLLDAVHWRLRCAGLDPQIFQFITHIENMNSIKPFPEYYRELLTKIGHKAEDVFLIGNDPVKDGSARKVGIGVALIDPKNSKQSFLRLKESLTICELSY